MNTRRNVLSARLTQTHQEAYAANNQRIKIHVQIGADELLKQPQTSLTEAVSKLAKAYPILELQQIFFYICNITPY